MPQLTLSLHPHRYTGAHQHTTPYGWEGEAGMTVATTKRGHHGGGRKDKEQGKWGRVAVEHCESSYCMVLASAARALGKTNTNKAHKKRLEKGKQPVLGEEDHRGHQNGRSGSCDYDCARWYRGGGMTRCTFAIGAEKEDSHREAAIA
uniref:Uncharacterized protein n=1 Tax=Romanomermis culicivorax TaxID=13658 RepID=A0A915JJX4_ROMCU